MSRRIEPTGSKNAPPSANQVGVDEGSATVIDPRCVHLFEHQGAMLAYFVETGALAEVDPALSDFLALSMAGDAEFVNAAMHKRHAQWHSSDLGRVLNSIDESGALKYLGYDKVDQDKQLERLWRHRPRRLQLLVSQVCNLKCVYCYEEFNGSNARGRLMTKEVAFQAIDYLVRKSGSRSELQITFLAANRC